MPCACAPGSLPRRATGSGFTFLVHRRDRWGGGRRPRGRPITSGEQSNNLCSLSVFPPRGAVHRPICHVNAQKGATTMGVAYRLASREERTSATVIHVGATAIG